LEKLLARVDAGQGYLKTEELIEVIFDNNFDFGTAFKSMVRAHCCTVGGGKEGNNLEYELRKVEYYVDKVRQRALREKV